jgi:hypothetical protein
MDHLVMEYRKNRAISFLKVSHKKTRPKPGLWYRGQKLD